MIRSVSLARDSSSHEKLTVGCILVAMPEAEPAPYPNNLRNKREEAVLTRGQLAALTARAAKVDEVLYIAVSERSLERLERGDVQPRMRTAKALAKALGCEVKTLFPNGVANQNRNPQGRS